MFGNLSAKEIKKKAYDMYRLTYCKNIIFVKFSCEVNDMNGGKDNSLRMEFFKSPAAPHDTITNER